MITKCVDKLPEITGFDYCEPKFKFGEVTQIILSHVYLDGIDVYPTDESDKDLWSPLFEADSDGDSGQVAYLIPVRGTLGEPDQTEIDASMDRKAYPPAEWTLECRVDDLSDNVYDALRQLKNKAARLWFIAGGNIFGGNQGIIATMNTFLEIEEGFDTMHNVHLRLMWKAAELPERADAPDFDEEEDV